MLIFLIILNLLLCIVCFYHGFIKKGVHSGQFKAGFLFCLSLLSISVYFQFRTTASTKELGKYITPYPKINKVIYVPTAEDFEFVAKSIEMASPEVKNLDSYNQLEKDIQEFKKTTYKYWILKTEDSAKQVLDFYKDKSSRKGWEVFSVDPCCCIFMRNREFELGVCAVESELIKETSIIYSLEGL